MWIGVCVDGLLSGCWVSLGLVGGFVDGCMCACMRACVCTCVRACVCTCVRACVRAFVCIVCMRALLRVCMCVYVSVLMYRKIDE